MKQMKKNEKKTSLPYLSSPEVHFVSKGFLQKKKINRRTLRKFLNETNEKAREKTLTSHPFHL
jgi:hypothetical protein